MTDLEKPTETMDLIRLTNSQIAALTPTSRQLVNEFGLNGLRQAVAIKKLDADLQRHIWNATRYADMNAKHDMGIVEVESVETPNPLTEELEEVRHENDELREQVERLQKAADIRREALEEKARGAAAVFAEGSQR